MPTKGCVSFSVAGVATRRKYCSFRTLGAMQAATITKARTGREDSAHFISLPSRDRRQALVGLGAATAEQQAGILPDQSAELVHVPGGPFEIVGDRIDVLRDRAQDVFEIRGRFVDVLAVAVHHRL